MIHHFFIIVNTFSYIYCSLYKPFKIKPSVNNIQQKPSSQHKLLDVFFELVYNKSKNIEVVIVLKKIFFILFIVIFFCFSTATSFAYEKAAPKRLAILPIITSVPVDPSIQELLMQAMKHELHVPLNSVLQAVEYISPEELSTTIHDLHYTDRDLLDKKNLQTISETLKADVTVGIAVTDLYEHRFYSFREGTFILESGVRLTLIGYDNSDRKFFTSNSSASYCDEYSPAGDLSALTTAACQDLLQKAALKKLIFPLSKSLS